MTATLAACLTPPGRGAIATIAVRGPAAWPVVRELFSGKHALPELPAVGRFWLGRFGKQLADEVVLAVRQVDPVPWIEIHGHGGAEAANLLLELLAERGIRVVSWLEFNRAMTPSGLQARALAELARAATTRVAAILLDQHHGAFERAVTAILEALERGDMSAAQARLDELARYAALGSHLVEPWQVAVIGPPNVGKSTLINALAGYQRSVVSASPGTTRDVVTTRLALDGWPVEVSDTAGLRDDAGDLEAEGIERARHAAARADLCLLVVDASQAAQPTTPEPRVRIVFNKIDLAAAQQAGSPAVSALTGQGIAELGQAIAGWLVPKAPPAEAAVPFTPGLAAGIAAAHAACGAGALAEAAACLRHLLQDETTSY